MSKIDIVFDKTFFDLQHEIKAVQDSSKPVQSFALYEYLTPEWQEKITTDPTSILHFEILFKNQQKQESFFEYFQNIEFQHSQLLHEYSHVAKMKYFIDEATKSDSHYIVDFCSLNDGFMLINLAMCIVFKRFWENFGLRDFLFCVMSTDENAYLQICRQMVQSRLHFMLHGRYLPIVAEFMDREHLTTILIFPVLNTTEGDLSTTTWNFIYVNSNGDNDRYIDRFERIPQNAFQEFLAVFRDFSHKSIMKEYSCVANIQHDDGTCMTWANLLVFQFLADFERLVNMDMDNKTKKTDNIALFCKYLAKMTKNFKTSNRYNQCITHLIRSFQVLVLDVFAKSGNPHHKELGPPKTPFHPPVFIDSGNTVFPTCKEFVHELWFGARHETIALDIEIFETMRKIQSRLQKHMRFALEPQNEANEETDDETEDERKRRLIVKEQSREFKVKQAECHELLRELADLYQEIQIVHNTTLPDNNDENDDDDDDEHNYDLADLENLDGGDDDDDVFENETGQDNPVDMNNKFIREYELRLLFFRKSSELFEKLKFFEKRGENKNDWLVGNYEEAISVPKIFDLEDKIDENIEKIKDLQEEMREPRETKESMLAKIVELQKEIKEFKKQKKELEDQFSIEKQRDNLIQFAEENEKYFVIEEKYKNAAEELLYMKDTIEKQYTDDSKVDLKKLHQNRVQFQKEVQFLFSQLHINFGFQQPPKYWLSKFFQSFTDGGKVSAIMKQIEKLKKEIDDIESRHSRKKKPLGGEDGNKDGDHDEDEDEDEDDDDDDDEDEDEDAKMEDMEQIGKIQDQIDELEEQMKKLKNESPKLSEFLSFIKLNEKIIRIEPKCSQTMGQLVEMKKIIENTRTSLLQIENYRETFRKKSLKFLATLSFIVKPGINQRKWFFNWFKKQTHHALQKCTEKIAKLEKILKQHQLKHKTADRVAAGANPEDVDSEIPEIQEELDKFNKQLKVITSKANDDNYLQQSDEFLSFVERMQKRTRPERDDDDDDNQKFYKNVLASFI